MKIEEPNNDIIYNIEIWNNYGLIRSEKYDNATEFMISTKGLIPGVYFMKIYRNGEFLSTQKLIIK
ncbi:MAG: T9SS type A sorting domain-containing protein [Paludibacteraceae bacterium]|nr:T9SS type A sorting domain-containing protein [Paludibacteraceae bacterium]